jgi:hypothetical protein
MPRVAGSLNHIDMRQKQKNKMMPKKTKNPQNEAKKSLRVLGPRTTSKLTFLFNANEKINFFKSCCLIWIHNVPVIINVGNYRKAKAKPMKNDNALGSVGALGSVSALGSVMSMPWEWESVGALGSVMSMPWEWESIGALGSVSTLGSVSALGSVSVLGNVSALGSARASGSVSALGNVGALGSDITLGNVGALGSDSTLGSISALGSV